MDVGQAWTLIAEPDADPLAVMAACEALVSFAQARQFEAIRDLSEQEPACYDPLGQLCDPVPGEIACFLKWTGWTASKRVDLAHELHEGLPAVLDALRAGLLDLPKVTEIVTGTCELTPATRIGLADRAIDYGTSHTRAQLRAWLGREVARLDPEAAEQRRKKARKRRRVWVQPEADGMATLGAYLTAEEAQSCYESLRAGVANHDGGVDAARADLLVERLSGVAPGEPIPVTVLVTPTGPELAGHGPISSGHFAALSGEAPRIRLSEPGPQIGYAPSVRMKSYVRARDRRCRFPGCRRPAVLCDLDHVVPFPAGRTEAGNLQCLCRFHHRLKTHINWTVTRTTDGTTVWTSPRGHRYTSRPDDP